MTPAACSTARNWNVTYSCANYVCNVDRRGVVSHFESVDNLFGCKLAAWCGRLTGSSPEFPHRLQNANIHLWSSRTPSSAVDLDIVCAAAAEWEAVGALSLARHHPAPSSSIVLVPAVTAVAAGGRHLLRMG